MNDLLKRLLKSENVLAGRGEKVVFPNAIVMTHSALPGEPANLGIWWYHLPTKKLLFSTQAWAHIDSEFVAQIPELGLARAVPNKLMANRAGWISGRVGNYEELIFVFLYTEELNGHLPGPVAADLIYQLMERSGQNIEALTDADGYALRETGF